MIQIIGKVTEVFIPEEYKNGNLLDVMDRTNIGFKVETDNGIKEIVTEADEFNARCNPKKGDVLLVRGRVEKRLDKYQIVVDKIKVLK